MTLEALAHRSRDLDNLARVTVVVIEVGLAPAHHHVVALAQEGGAADFHLGEADGAHLLVLVAIDAEDQGWRGI